MSKEINKIIPELRFPEFVNDGEWEIKSLKNVVNDFIVPMRDKPKKLDGEIPWCRIEDFDGIYLNGSKSNQGVTIETVKEMNLKVYPVNTLLVSCSADLGRCAITQKELVSNQTFIGLVPNIDKIDTVYLYNMMSKSRNELNARSSGTTISYLSRQEFEKFEIELPKLPEQQKIASCLSSLDDIIAAHNQKLDALIDHKKGLMQNLFPQNGEKVPKLRFPEFVNEGEWEIIELGKFCDYWNGASHENGVSDKGDFYLISLNSIDIDGNLKSDMKRLSYTDNSLQKNDLVMVLSDVAHGNFLGLTDIIPNDKYVLNQRMAGLRIKDNKQLNTFFLRALLNSNQKYFKLKGQGSSQLNLSKSSVIEFPVIFPKKILEQQKIASCLSSLDEIITAQTRLIEQLKLHKKGLMQGLFPKVNN